MEKLWNVGRTRIEKERNSTSLIREWISKNRKLIKNINGKWISTKIRKNGNNWQDERNASRFINIWKEKWTIRER